MARKSKPAYYAVARGKSVGIYRLWDECKSNTLGYSNASFKKFDSPAAAQSFINANQSGGSGGSGSSGSYSSSRSSGGSSGRSNYSSGSSSSGGGGYSGGYSGSFYSGGGSSKSSSSNASSSKSSSGGSSKRSAVYVDGASRGNGKGGTPKSGYGVYYGPGDSRNAAVSLADVDDVKTTTPTNQRAELHALKHALGSALDSAKLGGEKYEIFTDSSYAKNCVDNWSKNWANNDWKNSAGKDVANKDIIEDAVGKYNAINEHYKSQGEPKLEITHVRGHQGIEGNEQADRLANEGADKM